MRSKQRRIREDEDVSTNEWMTTYGDMVTLLLTFFILLFSISEVDSQKFEAIVNSLQGAPGVLKSGSSAFDSSQDSVLIQSNSTSSQQSNTDEFVRLTEMLQVYLTKEKINDRISIQLDKRGLVLRFEDNILFSSGKADIINDSTSILLFLSDILTKQEFQKYDVRVEGHTDSDPIINSSKFPTNWDLSVARSSNVVKFLIEQGKLTPSRLSAAGFSEYKPIALNNNDEGKKKNRRVDIVILRSE